MIAVLLLAAALAWAAWSLRLLGSRPPRLGVGYRLYAAVSDAWSGRAVRKSEVRR